MEKSKDMRQEGVAQKTESLRVSVELLREKKQELEAQVRLAFIH